MSKGQSLWLIVAMILIAAGGTLQLIAPMLKEPEEKIEIKPIELEMMILEKQSRLDAMLYTEYRFCQDSIFLLKKSEQKHSDLDSCAWLFNQIADLNRQVEALLEIKRELVKQATK